MNSNKTQVVLPVEKRELPVAIHEEIRQEKVKEVQPVVNIERDFTEVRQKTQPILDKEIKNVAISEKTLPTQNLPTINLENGGVRAANDVNTVNWQNTKSMTVEKPAIYNEVDKTRVIEEIQPVIYKETVVPSVTKETRPSYQKIVEGATFTNQTLPSVQLETKGTAYVPDQTVPKGFNAQVQLPTQRVELPTAVHESIRKEKVQEVQPVINIEKEKTHVIQKTQPILDKEIKPVAVQERTLDTQVLPQINLESKSIPVARDTSSVNMQGTTSLTIEKPAVYNEVDKKQVIEEIQPVIYKETVVPEVLKETKPVFQRVVEGTTYSSEVLPPIQLNSQSGFKYPENYGSTFVQQPTPQQSSTVGKDISQNLVAEKKSFTSVPKQQNIVEEKTTTVTQTTEQLAPKPIM